jgi:hypothetical protein
MEIYIDTVGTCTVYAYQRTNGGASVLLTRTPQGEPVCWLVEPTAATLADGRKVYHAYWGLYGDLAEGGYYRRTGHAVSV